MDKRLREEKPNPFAISSTLPSHEATVYNGLVGTDRPTTMLGSELPRSDFFVEKRTYLIEVPTGVYKAILTQVNPYYYFGGLYDPTPRPDLFQLGFSNVEVVSGDLPDVPKNMFGANTMSIVNFRRIYSHTGITYERTNFTVTTYGDINKKEYQLVKITSESEFNRRVPRGMEQLPVGVRTAIAGYLGGTRRRRRRRRTRRRNWNIYV